MNKRDFMRRALAAVALGLVSLGAHAQGVAEKPIRVVVPFAAGNVLDTAMRQVAEEFKKNTGQTVIVDNKPGGSGFIAAQAVMNAPADGNTLLMSNISLLTINPHTFSKLPYDPEKSFRPVTGFVGTTMVFAVHASVPASTMQEFVDWAKAQPTPVSYASWTAGNASHFAGVILNQRTGLNLTHVPYNGTPPVVQNLVGSVVQSAFLPLLAAKPHVDSGKLKLLAITSPQRSPLAPGVATFREQGLPDLEIYIWSGLSAPAATREAVVQRLSAEFIKAMKAPEIREKWRAMDFEALTFTPAEFQKFTREDGKRWAEAVRMSGFKANE